MRALNRKGDEDLTLKSIFAIFLVIFVMFVVFTVIRSRSAYQMERAQSEYYSLASSLLSAMAGSECFSVGSDEIAGWNAAPEAFLSQKKLDYYNNGNCDVSCVDEYDFLYSFTVADSITGRTWRIGLRDEPDFAEQKITIAMPVSIRYDSEIATINPGFAAVTAYIGSIPSFYGKIKQACTTHEDMQHVLISDLNVSYNSSSSVFKVGKQSFYSRFPCAVRDFKIEPGRHLLIISYNESSNSAKVIY
ncbi:hypothetical protein COT07_04990 [Candidatus Woesearchaeota archaeon CG07_land_8_20_14_0_80_44_23]|nr:MAG: hypothetical protein COT07_04990 [Candidatus Woesearchaeota archaeon CG07_land_8_20_14_0_80_44_23]